MGLPNDGAHLRSLGKGGDLPGPSWATTRLDVWSERLRLLFCGLLVTCRGWFDMILQTRREEACRDAQEGLAKGTPIVRTTA